MLTRTDLTQETAGLRQAGSLSHHTKSPVSDLSVFKYSRREDRRQDGHTVTRSPGEDDALGKTTSYASITSRSDARWSLLSRIKTIMQGSRHRVTSCMMTRGGYADLMQSGDDYYYSGIMTCGSVWTCPICRQKILTGRRQEIIQALKSGLIPVMVTITLQHHRSDSLTDLMDGLSQALRRLKSGRWWRDFRDRYHVKASVTTQEIRWSHQHGWHPHRHMILFCDLSDASEVETNCIQSDLTGRYTYLLDLSGHYASQYHGIDVRVGDEYIAGYLSKDNWTLAHEMSSTDTKSSEVSVSPFNLADQASQGDRRSYHLWMEYVTSTHGKRQITWSRGGKDLLGVDDLSDEDLASQTLGGDVDKTPQVVISIHRDIWSYILHKGLPGRLLEVARHHGQVGVKDYLREIERDYQMHMRMRSRGDPLRMRSRGDPHG